jgi:hypothetical protein
MHTMPSIDYMGYAIAVNALPAPGNRYYSVFVIRRHAPRGLGIQPPVAYQEGVTSGVTCETAELARQDAAERARTWIDTHPVE